MTSLNQGMKEKLMAIFAHRWLATILLIIILDTITFFAFTKTSGSVGFAHQDKVLHAMAFAVLTVVGHLSLNFDFFSSRTGFSFTIILVNVMLWSGYGVLIELGQEKLDYRQASIGDLVADMLGIGLGIAFVLALRLYPAERGGNHAKEGR